MGKKRQLLLLSRGWQKEAAKELGLHRNTISKIVKEGEHHRKYSLLEDFLKKSK